MAHTLRSRTAVAVVTLLLAQIVIMTVSASPAAADSGILRTVTAQNYNCSIGTGIAFNGTNLLLSCDNDNVITEVSPADGSFVRSYSISGVPAIGALAWDKARNLLWACGGFSGDDTIVYQIDLLSSKATSIFGGTEGCPDGLAYDGSDDTLFVSADVANTVQHYKSDGTFLSNIDVTGKLGSCGNSGLAVAGSQLLLSNDGCSQIYIAPKTVETATLFGSYPARLEDMECDDTTFAGQSKAAIWSKDAYDGILNAFDLGSVDCGTQGYRDSDGDGISDDWETKGVDINNDGVIDLDLPAMGADPRHKDVFAEVDWLTKDPRRIGPISLGGGYNDRPSTSAAKMVTQAFKNWPVPNPDGTQGINLHLDAGADSIMNPVTSATWGSRTRANAINNGVDFQDWKDWTQLDTYRKANVDEARRSVFHYILFVNKIGCINNSCTTGWSRGIPGHDLVIAHADIDTQLQEAVTVAHELGHNLGLGHGGRERTDDPGSRYVNNKANYLSIMNYFYSNRGLRANSGSDGIIALSPQELEPLNTTSLQENSGLEPDPFGHLRVDYRCPNGKLAKGGADAWSGIDWNCDGAVADGSSNSNLQNAADVTKYGANPLTVLGSDDYHALYFWGTGGGFDAQNASLVDFNQPGTEEPTVDQAKADGVWYPSQSLVVPSTTDVVAYPNTGTIAIPIPLQNPGAVDLSAMPKLIVTGGPVTLASQPISVAAGSTSSVAVNLDTSGLTAGSEFDPVVEFSVGSDALAQSRITIRLADPSDPNACSDASSARAAADVNPAQIPALDGFLATCVAVKPPTVQPDNATTNEDTPVGVPVLSNDSDPQSQKLSVTVWTQPAHGAVSCSATDCTYTPMQNYNGTDSFGYTVSNESGLHSDGTVGVTIIAINDPPKAVDDSATAVAGSSPISISVLGNDSDVDGDSLIVTAAQLQGVGTVSFSASAVIYTPPVSVAAVTTTRITYTISDGHGGQASATLTITVTLDQSGALTVQRIVVVKNRYVDASGKMSVTGGAAMCSQPFAVKLADLTLTGTSNTAGSHASHLLYKDTCVASVRSGNSTAVIFLNVKTGSWLLTADFGKQLGLGKGPTASVPLVLTFGPNSTQATINLKLIRPGTWVA